MVSTTNIGKLILMYAYTHLVGWCIAVCCVLIQHYVLPIGAILILSFLSVLIPYAY